MLQSSSWSQLSMKLQKYDEILVCVYCKDFIGLCLDLGSYTYL